VVGSFPGIWWPHVQLAVLLIALLKPFGHGFQSH